MTYGVERRGKDAEEGPFQPLIRSRCMKTQLFQQLLTIGGTQVYTCRRKEIGCRWQEFPKTVQSPAPPDAQHGLLTNFMEK
jgi:hypothetical protein